MVKWKAKQLTRVEVLFEQRKLKAQLTREQDLKNKPNFESKYNRPATNQPAIERGCSLNLARQGHTFS